MKRVFVVVAAVLLILSALALAAGWTKYVSRDGSFSFHYPAGWRVTEEDSAIAVSCESTDEELLILGVPFDRNKTVTDLASNMVNLLKESNPDIKAMNWRAEGNTVAFELTYTNQKRSYRADAVVIKGENQAHWFSYSAPSSGYSQEKALELLQAVIGSVASGAASRPPQTPYPPGRGTAAPAVSGRVHRNAEAFVFVVEFSLGAPFTAAQERIILNEIEPVWAGLGSREIEKFDAYPQHVELIMTLGQHEMEELRSTLEETIREWLDESPKSDPAVRVIRGQLGIKGKVLISGKPPLTEMSAAAYCELVAYARLLQTNPSAGPEKVSQASVDALRQQLLKVWNSLSVEERRDVGTTPGLWVCLRNVLKFGTPAEQKKTRDQMI